jgi:hypothetical protein
MSKLEDAVRAIQGLTTNDEINTVIEAIKLQRTWIARSTVQELCVGDRVSFRVKTGGRVRGTVLKLNRKTVIVDADVGGTRYKVSASLLEPAH